jgi:uncharacterized protein YuzE
MKLKIDNEVDALYLRLNDSAIVESEEVQSGVILDFNSEKHVIDIEFLGISKRVDVETLRSFLFESNMT